MIRAITYAAGIGLLGAQLAGCGGAVVTEQGAEVTPGAIVVGPMCDYIEDRQYYTAELGDGGDTLQGGRLGHWTAHFADGSVRFNHSHVGSSGSYTCEDGEVIVSLDGSASVALEFEHGENPYNSHLRPYQSFRFSPYGGETKRYVSADAELTSTSALCATVAGRTYKAEPATAPDVIAVETPFIAFGANQAVEYEIRGSGQAPMVGIYDCDLGEIHLHSDANDTNPVMVTLREQSGERVVVSQGDYSVEMVAEGRGCEAEARAMCVLEPQSVQCFTAPCPDGFHKTVMGCGDASPLPYKLVHEGVCGELEGRPYYEDSECATAGAVCGAGLKSEPCTTLPCPAAVHQTFDSTCAALNVNAPVLLDGPCGVSEGDPVSQWPATCAEQGPLPVCAKAPADIQCVTTPCPSRHYQTFVSHCEAQKQLASLALAGGCGELEGVLAFAEPPVHVVEQLPRVEKQVEVGEAAIEGDVLTVELAYSGCDEQHFHFLISSQFRESAPVQVDYAFEPLVKDGCLAYFTTRFVYDLLPLKHVYQQAYRAESGSIVLPGIGTYSF